MLFLDLPLKSNTNLWLSLVVSWNGWDSHYLIFEFHNSIPHHYFMIIRQLCTFLLIQFFTNGPSTLRSIVILFVMHFRRIVFLLPISLRGSACWHLHQSFGAVLISLSLEQVGHLQFTRFNLRRDIGYRKYIILYIIITISFILLHILYMVGIFDRLVLA